MAVQKIQMAQINNIVNPLYLQVLHSWIQSNLDQKHIWRIIESSKIKSWICHFGNYLHGVSYYSDLEMI